VADETSERGAGGARELGGERPLVRGRAHPDLHQLVRRERFVEGTHDAGRETRVAHPDDRLEPLRERAQMALLAAAQSLGHRANITAPP